jgi:hypothetical protein
MGVIKQIAAPIRAIFRFPLFQFALVVAVILLLQAADEQSLFGRIFNGLDRAVDATVQLVSAFMTVRSFTRSWLVSGFMITYVYLAGLLALWLLRVAFRAALDVAGRTNAFGLRNAIARERGIAAYRAWEPFEKIRPSGISQPEWEATYAWPADNRPPYPPLAQRLAFSLLVNLFVAIAILVLLQVFTPFPVLTWLGDLLKRLAG